MKKFTIIVNLINSYGKFPAIFLAALLCFGFQAVSAQVTPKPKPKLTPAPTPNPTSPTIMFPKKLPIPPKESKTVVSNEAGTPAEKSILTESKVSVNLCVLEGNVRINGWDRDEIRAFVEDGSEVGFKVVQYLSLIHI